MELLILLILFLILYPLLKIAFGVAGQVRSIKKEMNRQFGGNAYGQL